MSSGDNDCEELNELMRFNQRFRAALITYAIAEAVVIAIFIYIWLKH